MDSHLWSSRQGRGVTRLRPDSIATFLWRERALVHVEPCAHRSGEGGCRASPPFSWETRASEKINGREVADRQVDVAIFHAICSETPRNGAPTWVKNFIQQSLSEYRAGPEPGRPATWGRPRTGHMGDTSGSRGERRRSRGQRDPRWTGASALPRDGRIGSRCRMCAGCSARTRSARGPVRLRLQRLPCIEYGALEFAIT
jgi:hypothetical protein